jgi:aminocarboxymuconate-semialdehyde decarboxylase
MGEPAMTEMWNRYDRTAARAHGAPGRTLRPAGPTIDIHAHAVSPRAADFVRPHLPPPAGNAHPASRALGAKQNADRASRLANPAERISELDEMGIDIQVVMPSPGQCYHHLPPEIATQAARLVNEGMAEFAAHAPARLIPFGTVPLQSGDAGVDELEHCAATLGFKGVQVLTNVGGNELSDPRYAPFWAAAERLGMLVVIHPAGYTQPDRFARFYFDNVIGNPLDTTVALHHLIMDGVLARHPALKLMAAHGGGFLPAYSGRIDHAWGARSDAHGDLPEPPTTYLKRIYLDSVVFTPHQLAYLVQLFGADKILMGTDYPFDMGEYDPIAHVAGAGLASEDIAAICGGNARSLLGL